MILFTTSFRNLVNHFRSSEKFDTIVEKTRVKYIFHDEMGNLIRSQKFKKGHYYLLLYTAVINLMYLYSEFFSNDLGTNRFYTQIHHNHVYKRLISTNARITRCF